MDQHQNTTYAGLVGDWPPARPVSAYVAGFGAGLCCFFPAGHIHSKAFVHKIIWMMEPC